VHCSPFSMDIYTDDIDKKYVYLNAVYSIFYFSILRNTHIDLFVGTNTSDL